MGLPDSDMSHSFGKSRMDDVIANIGMSHSSFGSNGQGGAKY